MTITPTALTLLGLAAWIVILVASLGIFRVALALMQGRKANSFSPSGDDVGPFGRRLTRAHANAYEFLPAAGLVLLYAVATGQTAVTDGLAYAFLGARLAQSAIHIVSTANIAVLLRFAAFLVQMVILVIWILKLSGHM